MVKVPAGGRGLTIGIETPACHGARIENPAGVIPPDTDRGEGARRRRGLTIGIETPACYGARIENPAGVIRPGTDLSERARRRRGLTIGIKTPARYGARIENPAGVIPTGTDERDDVKTGRQSKRSLENAQGIGRGDDTVGCGGLGEHIRDVQLARIQLIQVEGLLKYQHGVRSGDTSALVNVAHQADRSVGRWKVQASP